MLASLLASSLALVLFAAGALAQAPSPSPSPSPAPSATPAKPVVVHIKNFAYVPATVKIPAGGSVRFVNDDDMPHTVTADDKSYDSGDLQKGASWTHRFLKVGSSTYTCTYHAFMRGGVEVTAP